MRRGNGWRGKLRGLGYRITLPRQAVLSVLRSAVGHLSAKEIFIRTQKICPACGLNTVYRTLEVLVDSGMVIRSDFGEGLGRYELNSGTGKNRHHHVLCVRCGKVFDYPDLSEEENEFFSRIKKELLKKHGFSITGQELVFKGVCGDCAAFEKGGD